MVLQPSRRHRGKSRRRLPTTPAQPQGGGGARRPSVMPLLNMPRLPYPAVECCRSGTLQSAPPALMPLLLWASEQLRALGAVESAKWQYQDTCVPRHHRRRCSTSPAPAVSVARGGASAWAHIGRAHASQHVMVTLDLCNELAWQRCWDQECVRTVGRGYVKARRALGCIPVDLVLSCGRISRALWVCDMFICKHD